MTSDLGVPILESSWDFETIGGKLSLAKAETRGVCKGTCDKTASSEKSG